MVRSAKGRMDCTGLIITPLLFIWTVRSRLFVEAVKIWEAMARQMEAEASPVILSHVIHWNHWPLLGESAQGFSSQHDLGSHADAGCGMQVW